MTAAQQKSAHQPSIVIRHAEAGKHLNRIRQCALKNKEGKNWNREHAIQVKYMYVPIGQEMAITRRNLQIRPARNTGSY